MNENKAQRRARQDEGGTDSESFEEKGPTEKLRDEAKSKAGTTIQGTEIPGAQNPESKEIKREVNPNTE